jgi:hypothetical protein
MLKVGQVPVPVLVQLVHYYTATTMAPYGNHNFDYGMMAYLHL